jgi:hypothetical protein
VVESLLYVTRHLQETGQNLYFSFVQGEPKLRYTFFKERSSTDLALLAIEELVAAIAFSNYEAIISYIVKILDTKPLSFSTRAMLAACLFAKDARAVLRNYQLILKVKAIPKAKYRLQIEKTILELKAVLA